MPISTCTHASPAFISSVVFKSQTPDSLLYTKNSTAYTSQYPSAVYEYCFVCFSLFSAFGELKSVRMPKKQDAKSGTSSHRGFAFLDFATIDDAKVHYTRSLFNSIYSVQTITVQDSSYIERRCSDRCDIEYADDFRDFICRYASLVHRERWRRSRRALTSTAAD